MILERPIRQAGRVPPPEPHHIVACGRYRLKLSEKTQVMGIINITPDSFSDGGAYFDRSQALRRIEEIDREGADIIDIGGESTRPGALEVSREEELDRVIPIVEKASRQFDKPISIDTRKAEVAEEALKAGATIVNDISGLRHDPRMGKVVAHYEAAVIIMHMRGEPRTMQNDPRYDDLMGEILEELAQSAAAALESGIGREKIIIDPGIGFGKTARHTMEILKRLGELKSIGYPIAIGTSRKSFIGTITGRDVHDRLWGSVASAVIAVLHGANIIRAHDVRQTVDAVKVADAIIRSC